MKISQETMAGIKKPVTDFARLAPLGNLIWQTCIDEGVTMGEFQKRGMVPRPNSIETFLTIMQMGFNPKNAGDTELTMQYRFSGQVEGECYLKIDNGEIFSSSGTIENPDLTIDSPFEVWMDILTRKADGAQMLMEGKYKVEGNTDLLLNMGSLFG
jgi:alkyl sulfatase BDS1-like metallo-beta-lactamase superfamily hydrolase